MKYLIDTCIFFHKLKNGQNILDSCEKVIKNSDRNCISNVILKELEEPINDVKNNNELHTIVKNTIYMFKRMDLIDTEESANVRANLQKIRDRFYGWQKDTKYLQKLIAEGVLTREEIKAFGFRYKDMGECSLIAIALTAPNEYTIVTEDKGKVYKFPSQNLFEVYNNVEVVNYDSWIGKVENNEVEAKL